MAFPGWAGAVLAVPPQAGRNLAHGSCGMQEDFTVPNWFFPHAPRLAAPRLPQDVLGLIPKPLASAPGSRAEHG